MYIGVFYTTESVEYTNDKPHDLKKNRLKKLLNKKPTLQIKTDWKLWILWRQLRHLGMMWNKSKQGRAGGEAGSKSEACDSRK